MKFTKSLCPHSHLEKCSLSIYSCKSCSITQLILLSKLLKKKNADTFCKPSEYCFNYEINIIKQIKNQIINDEKHFINYKKDLENLDKNNNNLINEELDSSGSLCNNNKEEKTDNNSFDSNKTESENNSLYALSIYYKYRKEILLIVKKLCNKYKNSKHCFYLTMTLIEKFFKMWNIDFINKYDLDLVTNAIFILVYKFIDSDNDFYISYESFKTFFYKEIKLIRPDDLKKAEIQCLQILEYNLNIPTILNFLELVLSSGIILDKEIKDFNIVSKVYQECLNLLNFCFEKNDIMLEHSMSEIIFSIIYLVRKQNNLMYKIEKIFKKIYKIELKKYLNCLKVISSIYYKNDNIYNNLFVLNNKKKEITLITEKQLKPINKRKDNYNSCERKTIENSYVNDTNNDKKRFALFLSKSKSLDNNTKEIREMIAQLNKKEKDLKDIKDIKDMKDISNNNIDNSIFHDSSTKNMKSNDKSFLKPIKFNSSRNFINSRYNNASNANINNSNYIISSNNEINNKLRSSNFSTIEIKRNDSMNVLHLKDLTNDNSSKKLHENIKVSSSINLLNINSNLNSISKYRNNLINSFRKNFEVKDENNIHLLDNKDSSNKNELRFYLNNKNKDIYKQNNKNRLSYKKRETRNIFENVYRANSNINDIIVKLPRIKK